MALNLDRKTPGFLGIFFGAVSAVLLGAIVAALHLASKPVEVVATLPKEPTEGVRYFVLGATSSTGKAENSLESLRAASGELKLAERDLNAWAATAFTEMKVEDPETVPFVIVAGKPNFRIAGTELQVGAINRVWFFGSSASLVLQATGSFTKQNAQWAFRARESFLGSLALHRFPLLQSFVASRFIAKDTVPEDAKALLTRAAEMSVANGALVVRMP
ncbi:MAG: hypothetical protein EAZ36_01615 [Verrucomicrobia bacterium]|nr:MAG: hypothetical protein EAZ36_01615 [Verrucomicrobiota bacterium]